MICEAEWKVLRDTPAKHASVARQVDLAMAHGDRPCAGGDCDLDEPCPRHARTLEVVERYLRMKARR